MTSADMKAPVGRLVTERPGRSRVFDRLGIDYCCGGRKPLDRACQEKGLDVDEVLREIEASDAEPRPEDREDWAGEPMGDAGRPHRGHPPRLAAPRAAEAGCPRREGRAGPRRQAPRADRAARGLRGPEGGAGAPHAEGGEGPLPDDQAAGIRGGVAELPLRQRQQPDPRHGARARRRRCRPGPDAEPDRRLHAPRRRLQRPTARCWTAWPTWRPTCTATSTRRTTSSSPGPPPSRPSCSPRGPARRD